MVLIGRALETFRVICRQLVRNPRRTIITFFGLVVSFFLYTLLKSSLDTMERDLKLRASGAILSVAPRAASGFSGLAVAQLPRSYASELRDTPGVLAVSPIRVFIGKGRSEESGVLALGVEWDSIFDIRPMSGISPEEAELLASTRSAALVGRPVLDQNQWKIGDRVTVRTSAKGPSLPLTIVGDIDGDDIYGAAALVDIDYLGNVVGDGGRATYIQVKAESADYAASLGRLIDARFNNYSVPTETKSEKAHMANVLSGFTEIFGAFEGICYLTLLVTVLVVANSVSMSIRERTVEIGTLRALGFSKPWIISMILGESTLVSIIGGVAGGLLAFGVASLANAGYFATDGQPPPNFLLDASSLMRTAFFALVVGALAALQPVVRAVRMPIATALRFAM